MTGRLAIAWRAGQRKRSHTASPCRMTIIFSDGLGCSSAWRDLLVLQAEQAQQRRDAAVACKAAAARTKLEAELEVMYTGFSAGMYVGWAGSATGAQVSSRRRRPGGLDQRKPAADRQPVGRVGVRARARARAQAGFWYTPARLCQRCCTQAPPPHPLPLLRLPPPAAS